MGGGNVFDLNSVREIAVKLLNYHRHRALWIEYSGLCIVVTC